MAAENDKVLEQAAADKKSEGDKQAKTENQAKTDKKAETDKKETIDPALIEGVNKCRTTVTELKAFNEEDKFELYRFLRLRQHLFRKTSGDANTKKTSLGYDKYLEDLKIIHDVIVKFDPKAQEYFKKYGISTPVIMMYVFHHCDNARLVPSDCFNALRDIHLTQAEFLSEEHRNEFLSIVDYLMKIFDALNFNSALDNETQMQHLLLKAILSVNSLQHEVYLTVLNLDPSNMNNQYLEKTRAIYTLVVDKAEAKKDANAKKETKDQGKASDQGNASDQGKAVDKGNASGQSKPVDQSKPAVQGNASPQGKQSKTTESKALVFGNMPALQPLPHQDQAQAQNLTVAQDQKKKKRRKSRKAKA